jgi:hypothetical protein
VRAENKPAAHGDRHNFVQQRARARDGHAFLYVVEMIAHDFVIQRYGVPVALILECEWRPAVTDLCLHVAPVFLPTRS